MSENATYKAMQNMFAQPDPASAGVYNSLMSIYPAFAKKIFERGDFMSKLVRSGMNPMFILDYPICGRCEALAPQSGPNRCTCMRESCGHTTVNPVTFRVWLKDELKRKAPPQVVDAIDLAVDSVALTMMRMAERELKNAMAGDVQRRSLIMPDGSEHAVMQENKKAKITVNETMISDSDFNDRFNDVEVIE